jgi:quinoprotein glucose dehydrogenase
MSFRLPAAAVCLVLLAGSAFGFVPAGEAANPSSTAAAHAGPAGPSGYEPPIAPASDEAQRALSGFRVPEGMKGSLVAAEPQLANPVAFWIDEKGRYWVCETFRQGNAVVDNRDRGYWLLDDLAAQTVEDRLAYYKKHLGEEGLKAFSEHHDRIRLLTDTNGDGAVDEAKVFADGFHDPEEGTGAGVMTVGRDVYYTDIPNLWRLRDTNGDGVADEREKLISGFGVRTAFRGHDMHGLTMGPDGRIYFSIGDRGFNIVTKEGQRIAMPDRGAVFRCEPDGSHLEVFASGLRNPQELAFDDYGNLFTGDNNSDSGDRARWVYVAEGSDSGWRMYYQYLDDRGPWNREMMWFPHDAPALDRSVATGAPTGVAAKDIQPAYILPPVTNLGDGPSGLTYYPGVGLSDRYKGHFFLCDFRGTPSNSGVRSFAVKPKGAGFEVVDSHEFIWSILCTDADFAPDGRFVISDWVNGWNGEGKGRLYAFTDTEHQKDAAESAKLLAEDFSKRTPEQLIGLFSHQDRRVRQKAQFELAKRPVANWPIPAIERLQKTNEALAGVHLTWALGQRARLGDREALTSLAFRAGDDLALVRAQAIKMIGDALTAGSPTYTDERAKVAVDFAAMAAASGISDKALQVRLQAIVALGKLDLAKIHHRAIGVPDGRVPSAFEKRLTVSQDVLQHPTATLLNLLAGEAGRDPVVRCAAQAALARLGGTEELAQAASHDSENSRLGAVVALRRLNNPQVGGFLADREATVVTEAARAINDVPIDAATAQLAGLAGKKGLNDPTLRRVLNANFRLGGKPNAEAVAKVAADGKAPAALRVEAVAELKLWADPPKLDRVTGMYRPVEARDASFMAEVVRPVLGGLLAAPDAGLRKEAIELAAAYKVREAVPALTEIAGKTAAGDTERVAALTALAAVGAEDLDAILAKAVEDKSAALRSEARSIWAKHDPDAAVPVLDRAIAEGETVERQAAIATLADLGTPEADAALARWFDKFVSGQTPAEIGLDLLEAAEKRPALKGRLEAYRSGLSADDPLAAWRTSLSGGSAARGREIFLNRASVSCLRCHKVEDDRGGEVGPNLSKIGAQKDRAYLLESVVAPNAKVAQGFESVVIVTTDGRVISGVKRAEDEKSVTVMTPEGKGIVVPKNEIEEQAAGKSAMPDDVAKHLSPRDVRDLVEYLAAQKGEGRWKGTEE